MKKNLHVAFFGSSLVSAYWNGAATYYRGILKELNAIGYRCTFYEPDAYGRQQHRDIENPDYAESVVYSADQAGVDSALKKASEADVIVKTSGVGAFDEYLEEAVLQYKDSNRTVVFWDVDAPATLDRIKNDPQDKFGKLVSSYDVIFTYGGGDPVVKEYERQGARVCIPVYNALDPSTHFPVGSDGRFEGTLGFLGNRLPDREARVHEFFFEAARVLESKLFVLGGNGWEKDAPDYKNIRKVGHVYTTDHNAFNCSTLVTLNINRQSMAQYGFSPPTRIFEAAGAGACIITDAWEGIGMFLEPGKECFVAGSGREVADIISQLDINQAKKTGLAARERILSEHTYRRRALTVDRILTSCKSKHEEVVS